MIPFAAQAALALAPTALSLFTGGGRAAGRQTNRLASLLDAQATGPLTAQPAYNTGMGALRDLMRDQGARDSAAAAARGLSGGAFESGATAQRMNAQASAQRGLLADAAGQQRSSLYALIGLRGQQDAQAAQSAQAQGGMASTLGQLMMRYAAQAPGNGGKDKLF